MGGLSIHPVVKLYINSVFPHSKWNIFNSSRIVKIMLPLSRLLGKTQWSLATVGSGLISSMLRLIIPGILRDIMTILARGQYKALWWFTRGQLRPLHDNSLEVSSIVPGILTRPFWRVARNIMTSVVIIRDIMTARKPAWTWEYILGVTPYSPILPRMCAAVHGPFWRNV